MKQPVRAFTLVELLIVITMISLLVIASLYLLKPLEQFSKARDTIRKNDLNELRKIFEDWRTDTNCYPKKSEVCYDDVSVGTIQMCHVCTSHQNSPSLNNYSTSTICDPQYNIYNYLYQPQGDANCPTAYILYSNLTSANNRQNDIWGCGPVHGCGPIGIYGYDYLVSSPNAVIVASYNYTCLTYNNRCSSCGSYSSCLNAQASGICGPLYATKNFCCITNPGAGLCP